MNFRWMLATLASILLLVTGACGDDDSAPSTSASATATATATASGDAPDDSETPKRTSTPKKTATPKDTDEPTETLEGGDDTTPEIDECDLISPDDITDATGEQYSEDGQAGFSDPDTCFFDGEDGGSVEISVYDLTSYGPDAKAFFELFADVFEVELLDDPGDEAYYDETIGIAVLDGDYEIDIFVQNGAFEPNRDASFALADVALGNMP